MILTITLSTIFFGVCCFSEDFNFLRHKTAEEQVEQN